MLVLRCLALSLLIEFAASECFCGMKKQAEPRIVGGSETGVNEYPMMAALLQGQRVRCGATVISDHYALTAAHCVKNVEPSSIKLLVGEHDLTTENETDGTKQLSLSAFIMHPEYDVNTNENDIALVKTAETIAVTPQVMPVCLPFAFSNNDFGNEVTHLLGWGHTAFGRSPSNVLLHTEIKTIPLDKCKSAWSSLSIHPTDKSICTFGEKKDVCQHDSGGPLLWQMPGTDRLYIIGVYSIGVDCGKSVPGVHTRVTSHLDWIMSVVEEEDQICKKP